MKILANQTGVVAPDAAYPNGSILDGATIIGEGINQDIVQFLQKLAIDGGIAENDLPDNVTNGYQLIEALTNFTTFLKGATAGLTPAANAIDISGLTIDDYRKSIVINIAGSTTINDINGVITPLAGDSPKISMLLLGAKTFTDAGNITILGASNVIFQSGELIEFRYVSFTNSWHLLTSNQPKFETEIVAIGNWDMVAAASVVVAHGITDFTKIMSVDVLINNDASTSKFSLLSESGSLEIDATNISLGRVTGSGFDSTNFDLTPFDRGTIVIKYQL